MEFDETILDTNVRIVFFPVRHHSPAAARVLRELVYRVRPQAILIEGPSDFNSRIEELYLPHKLPVAIYSYWRLPDGARSGAYYPFCAYSPEWEALRVAREIGAKAEFIDLPWAEVSKTEIASHRYADGELRSSRYVRELCRKLGAPDFDSLWDTLIEIDPNLTIEQYLERCHRYCFQCRALDEHIPETDIQREAFMVQQILRAMDRFAGKILVVTGGFHSFALFEQIKFGVEAFRPQPSGCDVVEEEQSLKSGTPNASTPIERGIALTPYSYERLDNLTGYDSGMPNPGFYHRVWEDRQEGKTNSYRHLLAQAVKDLRERKQTVSAADLIAVETMAQGLATLRSHAEVWRRDLIDGITGALVKEELDTGLQHPFLSAIHQAFRGKERGRLAEGTSLPPLVHDIKRSLEEHELEPTMREQRITLDLLQERDLRRSYVLHRLRALGIAGFAKIGGSDLVARDDLARVWEEWLLRWSPEFEAGCIESAVYGPTLIDAAIARLKEQIKSIERNAEAAALRLLDVALMGIARSEQDFSEELKNNLVDLIRDDGNFFTVAAALDHLLYLYRYDEIFGTASNERIGALLSETFYRSLWLLESSGAGEGNDKNLLKGVRALLHTFERCAAKLELSREELINALRRISQDNGNQPVLRGAMMGCLWSLNETNMDQLQIDLRYCSEPDRLGDFLTGLFALARETAQRHAELVVSIDEILMSYTDDNFLEALPALRLAFTYFTPREKHYIARTLLEAKGMKTDAPLPELKVSVETAARALALESKLFQIIERYGLRGV
jgi:hypothetical protein